MVPLSSKKLLNNISALFLLQLTNYLLPFLLIPYLTRVLGVALYGVVAFGMSIVQLAFVVTDFGFNLYATAEIARENENKETIERIISSVMLCKIGLLAGVIVFLSLFIVLGEKYVGHSAFLWMLILPIVGMTFQPIWFFQGIERMGFITLYTALARGSYIGLVVLWVSGPSDYHWVAIAYGCSHIAAAMFGMAAMLNLGYKPVWPGFEFVSQVFFDSLEFFWARAAVAAYTAGGVFFLGLFSSPVQVAYYSAAEQMYKGGQAFLQPLTQALYPYMAKNKNYLIFFKLLKLACLTGVCGAIIGLLFGDSLIKVIFGSEFADSYGLFLVFMVTILVTIPSVFLGYPFLGALGYSKPVNNSVLYGALFYFLIVFFLYISGSVTAFTLVFAVLIVEVLVFSYRALKVFQIYRLKG